MFLFSGYMESSNFLEYTFPDSLIFLPTARKNYFKFLSALFPGKLYKFLKMLVFLKIVKIEY